MSAPRSLRTVLAAALLLLHALLPGLHAWEHAIEATADRLACEQCEQCGDAGRDAGSDVGRDAGRIGHQHAHADECALCAGVELGRNVLSPGTVLAVQPLQPPVRTAAPVANRLCDCNQTWRPPARAPPLRLC